MADRQNHVNQQRFIRVVDIFYHLFDQQDLPELLQATMTTNADSACMSVFEFEKRYCLPCEAAENDICARTKQKIDEIIDSLDNYYLCDHQEYQDIEQVFSSNRHAFNYQLWLREDEEEQTLCRLIGAVLLNFDRNAQRFDHYTEALLKWVSYGLHRDVFTQFEQHSSQSSPLLQAWLIDGQSDCLPALLSELETSLHRDSYHQSQAKLGATQPQYALFSSVDVFRPILATCYWLYKVNQDDFAKRVINLYMALAPQATIASMANFYRRSMGYFASPAQQNAFFMQLFDLGISYIAQCAYHIALAVQYDVGELTA
ncbi:hypothetical protein JCM19238_2015 [Vibrio ponticus]|nr:hypothetical protein JCM19238_2015 [Vibrio ponticus]